MRRISVAIAAVAIALVAPSGAFAAETITQNGAPAAGYVYGSGNDYSPANAEVLTSDDGTELALRLHETYTPAPASDSSGVYFFALGTDPISFDWSIYGDYGPGDALITLTNLLTGQTMSYDPLCPLGDSLCVNDNESGGIGGLVQNSYRLNWAGIGFDPNTNNTYQVDLAAGGHSLTAFAQLGTGVGAVPEPATWAMMLIGFGGIGFSMRRRRRTTALPQLA